MNSRDLKLGLSVKKLQFKLLKIEKKNKTAMYHIVVSRKRSGSSSRLDKVGFFHFCSKKIQLMGLNYEKIKFYVKKGATFHLSVLKFLL